MKVVPVKFENPSNKSIYEVSISVKDEGREKQIPAISKDWIELKSYTKYVSLSIKNGQLDQKFLLDEWVSEVQWFNKDLEFILGMEYYKFWSHVCFDPTFLDQVLFYLQESTPFYLPIRKLTENKVVIELYDKVAQNVLAIVCRLITSKESESEWMPKQSLADVLYKNFIISIPMIFDLITLYGQSNLVVLKKFLDTLLKIENKYLGDLQLGTRFIRSTFSTLQKQLENDDTEELLKKYEDLTLYLLNTIVTLNLLVEICPTEFKEFCSTDLKLEQTLASFYDNFVPVLYEKIYSIEPEAWFLVYLNYARVEIINGFRNLLSRNVENIFNGNAKNAKRAADNLLSILTECAGFLVFVADYRRAFPIEIDLDVIDQSCKNMDEIKLNFVRDAYAEKSDAKVAPRPANGVHRPIVQEEYSDLEGAVGGVVETLPIEPANNEELIQQETGRIMELFQDYGVGYIRRLLAYYDNSSEKVISAILEGNLAPDLVNCDQKELYIPPEVPDEVFAATGLERSNIYDGDEFDVMRIKEFTGIVKFQGRTISKKEPRNLNDLLNDKTQIRALQDRYQTYGMVNDLDDDENANLYDDEFDDSYDVYTENAPKIKLNANMRNILIDEVEEESDSEDEPEQASSSYSKPANSASSSKPQQFQRGHNDFCENPEVIRARREQAYQAKHRRGGPARSGKPDRDVVGAAKGQGQSSEVVHNRANKGANKATRGNHSRKRGADFKASRGMF